MALESFHRPASLSSMKLCDNSAPHETLVEQFHLEKLEQRVPNASWYKYMNYLKNNDFLSVGREQKRFFNLRELYKQTGSDGGQLNLFPIDLSNKRFMNSTKKPFRLEIGLSTPNFKTTWYVVTLFEFGAQAKFTPLDKTNTTRRFDTSYAPLPWF